MNADRNTQAPSNGKCAPKHRSNGNASTPEETDDPEQGRTSEVDALKLLLKQFHELREYFSYYVTAKTDGVKLSLRNISLWMVLASLGFIAVGGLIVTANWFVLSGAAEGLGLLYGGRSWAGKITAGLLSLAILGLCMCYTAAKRKIASRERTVQKYEKRQAEQQAEFGRNVLDQAVASEKK